MFVVSLTRFWRVCGCFIVLKEAHYTKFLLAGLISHPPRLFAHGWELCRCARIDPAHDPCTRFVIRREDHEVNLVTSDITYRKWMRPSVSEFVLYAPPHEIQVLAARFSRFYFARSSSTVDLLPIISPKK